LEKSEINQERDKPFPLNNIGYVNSNYANKPGHKNFEFEKFHENLNSAVKIMNKPNKDDMGKNSIMTYENINYFQKVGPSKKSNMAYIENCNDNLNFFNEDEVNQKVKI